jgi:hypothetical protein
MKESQSMSVGEREPTGTAGTVARSDLLPRPHRSRWPTRRCRSKLPRERSHAPRRSFNRHRPGWRGASRGARQIPPRSCEVGRPAPGPIQTSVTLRALAMGVLTARRGFVARSSIEASLLVMEKCLSDRLLDAACSPVWQNHNAAVPHRP